MRTVILLAVAGVLAAVPEARAGLYIPGEPPEVLPEDGNVRSLPFDRFRQVFAEVRLIPVPTNPEQPIRKRYTEREAELVQRGGPAKLSVEELIEVSGLMIRLRHYDGALEALTNAKNRDNRDVRVMANLALYYHANGQPVEAQNYQESVVLGMPDELPGMTREQTKWLKRCERAWRDVLRLRAKEGPRAVVVAPDALFQVNKEPVQFVGASGTYEAGVIAEDQKTKLPADAIALVQQLLMWTPDDTRLYWLLGELYNATGEVAAAATIFDECVDARRFQPDLLKDHRRVVKAAIEKGRDDAEQEKAKAKDQKRSLFRVFALATGALVGALVLWQLGLWALRGIRAARTGSASDRIK